MKKNTKPFFKSLPLRDLDMCINLYYMYLILGIFTLLISSVLPMMRAQYGFSYEISGYIISANNVGNVIAGSLAGFFTLHFGMKHTLVAFNVVTCLGFVITLITGNPYLLIFAMLLTGLGRGIVGNYSNQALSQIAHGNSFPLNLLHACFAAGAVIAPLMVLFCTNRNITWQVTIVFCLILAGISVFSSGNMDMRSVEPVKKKKPAGKKETISWGFFKDLRFLKTIAIMFFYMAIEASIMGWMVTYYTDSGVLPEDQTQLLTSLFWVTILIGRFACSFLSRYLNTSHIICILSAGMLVFLFILVRSSSLIPMLAATIGLGLFMSGMYATTIANAGSVFGEYPMAMSLFFLITTCGSIFTPSIIGSIAEATDIRTGMTALLLPTAIMLGLAVINLLPDSFVQEKLIHSHRTT